MSEAHSMYTKIGLIAVLIGALFLLSNIAPHKEMVQQPITASSGEASAEVQTQLASSKGFQEFVSYTDRGFEPNTIAVKQGDTIRWTNNSSGNLWIASDGGTVYPRSANDCGSSAFDSCKALKPGDFWEFTFDTKGSWLYLNNLQKDVVGVVQVK